MALDEVAEVVPFIVIVGVAVAPTSCRGLLDVDEELLLLIDIVAELVNSVTAAI